MARHPRAKAPGKDLLKDLLKVAFKQRRLHRTAATSQAAGRPALRRAPHHPGRSERRSRPCRPNSPTVMPLNAQQRQEIYQAVMADKSPPAADTAKLKPANALPFEQRRDMRPLPESLAAIDGLQGLKYVKGKDKVLLVRPSTGIVVDEITM